MREKLSSQFSLMNPALREVSLKVAKVNGINLGQGVVGFSAIEGWNYFDSLYMTVITLTTVGFQEVHPLSNTGRTLAMCLIVMGVGVATVGVSLITRKILEQQILWFFERRKMQQQIDKLENHTIFCGYGRLCQNAAKQFSESDKNLVIVEGDEETAAEASAQGYLVVRGDAAQEETLLRAGIMKAKRLVSLVSTDADNLYIILTSRELNPKLFIVTRADDEAGEKHLKRAGADRVLSPYRIGGVKIAEGLLRPHVTDFLDIAATGGQEGLLLEEIKIPDKSPIAGRSLQESALRAKSNVVVAAIISKTGEMIFNPSGDTIIEGGSTFIGFGYRKDFSVLERVLVGG